MSTDKIIRCRCDPISECTIKSPMGNYCLTNEGCFKSIQMKSQGKRADLNMGCFKDKSQHYLMHCKVKPLSGVEIKCCRDRDYCNGHLSLASEKWLNVSDPVRTARVDQYSGDASVRLVFAIVVPICLLIILAVLITLFWKTLWHHKRKSSLKLLHHSKSFHDQTMVKTPLFMCPVDINPSIHRQNMGLQVETLTGSGLPGSKNSSGFGVKSNGTATTLLSGSNSCPAGTLEKLRDDTITSGSGSGLPFLVQRTVARQITLIECIGKGKFGEVWKGQFQGELVAVKIFSSREESSWTRETTIYNTVLLRHDNILGYYASDLISNSGCTQLWMVMQYHPMGSLNDFLTHNSLSIYKALKLAHSAAAGLCHLHTSIVGLQGKPTIAHRDVKSKNILVKSNGTCCIADLGLAVFPLSLGSNGITAENSNIIVGTKRYMAPELLELACSLTSSDAGMNVTNLNHMYSKGSYSINVSEESCMDSLKAVDVYAFSLVLWEIVTCVLLDGITKSYQLPFSEMVIPDPSFEDMYDIVVAKRQRPLLSDSIKTHLGPVARIIEECWHQRPSIRLTMLRIKKSLFLLMKQISSLPAETSSDYFPSSNNIPDKNNSETQFPLPTFSTSHSS